MSEFTLDEEIIWLRKALVRESNAAVTAQQQLTAVQQRCTQLVEEKRMLVGENMRLKEEIRELSQALILPGWTCQNKDCRVFNGEAKEKREVCRSCDTPRIRMVESSS